MKKRIAAAVAVFMGAASTVSAASLTGFLTEANYNGFLGAQQAFYGFDTVLGTTDGVYAAVDFNTLTALDPTQVTATPYIGDAGSTTAANGVGRIEGVFTSDTFAIGMKLLAVEASGEVAIFDGSDNFLGAVGYSGNGFVGIASDMAFRRFELRTGNFGPNSFDRVLIDDFRINALAPVPLPASGLLLLLGLGALGLRRRG